MMKVSDYNAGMASTPASMFYADGVEEILGDTASLVPLSGLEGIDLGPIGGLLDPLGLFRTGPSAPPPGGAPAPSSDGGGLLGGLSLGGLIPNPMGLINSIGQGVGQALGLGPASTPGGSVLGAAFGGAGTGTGPLPGQLGQAALNAFGYNGLPPAGTPGVNPVDYQQIANHTEKAGRAVVRRVLGGLTPHLAQIRGMLNQRRNQIQATAEHRQLNAATDAHRQVVGYLGALLDGGGRRSWQA